MILGGVELVAIIALAVLLFGGVGLPKLGKRLGKTTEAARHAGEQHRRGREDSE